MDFYSMMRQGGTDQTDFDDWWADRSAAMREFAEAILAAGGSLDRTCGGVRRAVAIIRDDDRRSRLDERSGWIRQRPRPAPQVGPYRTIALRRTPPPRNRSRSRPGGKWAAKRAG